MIGQDKLLKQINSYTLDTLPHTILLVGESGCGKHLLVNELAKKHNVCTIDMTEQINLDFIDDIYLKPLISFYIVDTTYITEKHQNILLKFIEEPPKNAYIFLLCENTLSLLNTIINRCMKFEFTTYTRDELLNFTQDENILNVAHTPGQAKSMNISSFNELQSLCTNIVEKTQVARLQNILTIANKINYKDEYDKFDINIFFRVLINSISKEYIELKNTSCYYMYDIVNNYYKRLRDSRLNKEYLIENMLIELWKGAREWVN